MQENKAIMRRYVLAQAEIEVPEFQKRFALSYIETKAFIDELSKEGLLEFVSGVTYKVNVKEQKPQEIYQPKNEDEKAYIKILWECVKSRSVSIAFIVSRCKVGYAKAASAMDWMEEKGHISPYPVRRVRLTPEEFIREFGNPDEAPQEASAPKAEEPPKPLTLEEYRNRILRRLHSSDDEEKEKEKEKEDEDEDEDAGEEIDWGDDDEDEDENENKVDTPSLKMLLAQSLLTGLQDGKDDTYTLDMAGGAQYELKFIHDGKSLRFSDGGTTMAQTQQTERKVKNALKNFPSATLENGEITVVSTAPCNGLMALLTLYAAVTAVKNLK